MGFVVDKAALEQVISKYFGPIDGVDEYNETYLFHIKNLKQ
jgi:hypothetical protein